MEEIPTSDLHVNVASTMFSQDIIPTLEGHLTPKQIVTASEGEKPDDNMTLKITFLDN